MTETHSPAEPVPFRAGRRVGEMPETPALAIPAEEERAALGFTGPTVLVADVSEFQPNIADDTYVHNFSKAIIIRASYGTAHVDRAWYGGQRRAELHKAGIRFLGIYQYIRAGQDALKQADVLGDMLGSLQPGEKVIADIEEGSGNQHARWDAWANRISQLGDHPWCYSGLYFAQNHGLAPVEWVAAYQRTEPSVRHLLWQFTDAYRVPGIGSCDCSVFHGTIDQLAALAYGGKGQQSWTEELMADLPTLAQGAKDTRGHIFYVHRVQALAKVIGQINNIKSAAGLATDGDYGAATKTAVHDLQKFFGFTGPDVDGICGPKTWHALITGTRP